MDRPPGPNFAIIDEDKLTRYLLASDHPAGRGKAAFFDRFGFRIDAIQILRQALLRHARSARVLAVGETRFGRKYILEGRLTAPDGRRPVVRAVWFVRAGEVHARLVTAYPVSGVER
jgi:hypothetical protein